MNGDLIPEQKNEFRFQVTSDESKLFGDWIVKFNAPTSRLAIYICKIIIFLQFTIVGSLLWVPWFSSDSTKYIIGFCLVVDFLRISFGKAVKTLLFGGTKVLADVEQTFDDTFQTDWFGIAFILIYLAIIVIAQMFSKTYSHLPGSIIQFYNDFSDVRNLNSYGFANPERRNFSFTFVIFLHSVTFLYLLYVSSRTIKLYNFRSLLTTNKLYVGRDSVPFNISRSLVALPITIILALCLHSVLTPSHITDVGNRYDWAGPVAMVIYALCECFIIAVLQVFNRYAVIPLQIQYVKS